MRCQTGLVGGRAWTAQHVWTHARHAALERDGHRCQRCGTDHDLHVHHIVPVDGHREDGCQHHLDNLVTLCEFHHRAEHRFLRRPCRMQEQLFAA